jgi:hypothetical protein
VAKLRELARLIRSKNAGPFMLTIDIMFSDAEAYKRARDAGVISKGLVSSLYNIDPKSVQITNVDPALAIKVSIPRPVPSGDLADADVFGGQQYGPLVDLEIP